VEYLSFCLRCPSATHLLSAVISSLFSQRSSSLWVAIFNFPVRVITIIHNVGLLLEIHSGSVGQIILTVRSSLVFPKAPSYLYVLRAVIKSIPEPKRPEIISFILALVNIPLSPMKMRRSALNLSFQFFNLLSYCGLVIGIASEYLSSDKGYPFFIS
jgi:hypothetical protein